MERHHITYTGGKLSFITLKVHKYDDEDQTPMSMKRPMGFLNFIPSSSAEDLRSKQHHCFSQ